MKKSIALLIVFLTAFCVFGTGVAEDEEQVTIEFAHMLPTEHVFHQTLQMVNDKLQESSDGRIRLQVYPNGTYGSQMSSVEAVRMGSLDMTEFSVFADYYKPSTVLFGPYLFRDYDHWAKFLESDIGIEIRDSQAEAAGVVSIALYTSGFRNVVSTRAARNPDEFSGMKMRVVDQFPYQEVATVLNTVGTPMSISDVYMALRTNVVEATENPLVQIYSTKFHEVTDYLILTEHMIAPSQVIMSRKRWNSLSGDDQQLIVNAFNEALEWNLSQVKSQNDELVQKMRDEGLEVITPDRAAFQERTALLLEKYPDWVRYYEEIQAIE